MTLILPKMSTWNFWNIFSPTVTCTKFKCKNNNKKNILIPGSQLFGFEFKDFRVFEKKSILKILSTSGDAGGQCGDLKMVFANAF